jgi:type IV pilus assembly protein PilP
MRYLSRMLMAVLFAGLAYGCGGNDFSDLHNFKEELRQRPKVPVEPLPEFMPYEPFAYSAGGMRHPFQPPVQVRPVDPDRPRSDVRPDPNRVRQYLEQYALGELKMVGNLSRAGTLYALIEDPVGGVHRVSPGDYMGRDHGRVIAVAEARIELTEIVPDGTGAYLERNRTVSLGGAE